MADITVGRDIRTLDAHQPSVYNSDDTLIANIAATGISYVTGSPEVGVFFIAPTSGRVRVTTGGGMRDNGTAPNIERVFIVPQIFLENSDGDEILAPSSEKGIASAAENTEFQYQSRVIIQEGLTPGRRYYARTMYAIGVGTDPDTADIASRDITVIPMP